MHPIPINNQEYFFIHQNIQLLTFLGSEKSGNCVKASPTIVNIIEIKTTKLSTNQ